MTYCVHLGVFAIENNGVAMVNDQSLETGQNFDGYWKDGVEKPRCIRFES